MNPIATIKLKDIGEMEFELFLDTPNSTANFISLAENKFYDGLTIHRLVKDFVAQGGCPDGTGMGGPGYTIDGEFSSNNFENPHSHIKGVLSWARSMARNSAGSQFFITLNDVKFLDPDYAVFGQIIKGEEILDILNNTEVQGENPISKIIIESVLINRNNNIIPELQKV